MKRSSNSPSAVSYPLSPSQAPEFTPCCFVWSVLLIFFAVVLLCVFTFCVPCDLCLFVHSGVQHILWCVFCFASFRLVSFILLVSLCKWAEQLHKCRSLAISPANDHSITARLHKCWRWIGMFCGKHGLSYLYPLLIQRIIMSRLKPAVNGTEKEIFQKHIKGCIPDIVDGKWRLKH
jgi:hypothetical protein